MSARVVPRGSGLLAPAAAPGLASIEVKLRGDALSVVEYTVPAGFSPPARLHRQTREDVTVYVLEGELHYWFPDGECRARTGTLIHLPRTTWSRWANDGDTTCRLLAVFTPGGFEQYFLDLAAASAAASGDRVSFRAAVTRLREQYGDEERPQEP